MRQFADLVEIIDPQLSLKDGNRVYTSLEGENPGGSMKDHMVRGEIEELLQSGSLRSGSEISEVSAGSTAASLSHYCAEYGIGCSLFVPTGVPDSLVAQLAARGAKVHQEPLSEIYARYEVFLKENPQAIRFDQLFDSKKRRHYHALGQHILNQIGSVQGILGAVGTGHSLLGVAEGLRSPLVISTEPMGGYKVSGVRNIMIDRYGDADKLDASDFSERIEILESQLITADRIQTPHGSIQVGMSFKLVLAGIETFLQGRSNQTVFALGASLKR